MNKPIATVDRTRELLELLEVRPLKRLGQNFLIQPQVAADIVNQYPLTKEDTVIEIGPGLGALTELLCQKAKMVYAIEYDHGLARALSNTLNAPNLIVIDGDALKIILPDDLIHTESVVLFSNVPYYITTDVILHALLDWPLRFKSVVLLVQKEVALKWSKTQDIDEQTASDCILRGLCDTSIGLHVSHHAFYPKPDVHSAVVVMKPKYQVDHQIIAVTKLINLAYLSKRKTIISNLVGEGYSRDTLVETFKQLQWSEMTRPSELSFEQWRVLWNKLGASHEKK